MRKAIAVLALMALSLPAAATEGTGIITWEDGDHNGQFTPMLEYVVLSDTELRYDIIGHYFVIQQLDGSMTSVDVPKGASSYTVHDNGTVTFDVPIVMEQEKPAPTPEPASELVAPRVRPKVYYSAFVRPF